MINREIMTENPVCCLPLDSVSKVAAMMKKGDFGAVPVIESQDSNRVVGIITDRDLALKVVAEGKNPESTLVESVMNGKVHTVRADEDVSDTLQLMADRQVRRIPVVEEDSRIIGIIAQADVATRLDQPARTGRVVDEISQKNETLMDKVPQKRGTVMALLIIAGLAAILVALNLLGIISIF